MFWKLGPSGFSQLESSKLAQRFIMQLRSPPLPSPPITVLSSTAFSPPTPPPLTDPASTLILFALLGQYLFSPSCHFVLFFGRILSFKLQHPPPHHHPPTYLPVHLCLGSLHPNQYQKKSNKNKMINQPKPDKFYFFLPLSSSPALFPLSQTSLSSLTPLCCRYLAPGETRSQP